MGELSDSASSAERSGQLKSSSHEPCLWSFETKSLRGYLLLVKTSSIVSSYFVNLKHFVQRGRTGFQKSTRGQRVCATTLPQTFERGVCLLLDSYMYIERSSKVEK